MTLQPHSWVCGRRTNTRGSGRCLPTGVPSSPVHNGRAQAFTTGSRDNHSVHRHAVRNIPVPRTGPKHDACSVTHRTEPRKPDTEGHTYDSPDRNRPERAPAQKQQAGWWPSGAGEGWGGTASGLGCGLEGRRWDPQRCRWLHCMVRGQRENWSVTVKR